MFDVGFSELVVIALVALIVIGPERLPKVARTAGILLGRMQRYVNEVKTDISREMHLEELKKLQSQVAEQARALEASASSELRAVETSLNQAVAELPGQAVAEAKPEPTILPPNTEPPEAQRLSPVSAADAQVQLVLGLDHPAERSKA